jgi:hypothetical protein
MVLIMVLVGVIVKSVAMSLVIMIDTMMSLNSIILLTKFHQISKGNYRHIDQIFKIDVVKQSKQNQ